MPRFKLRPWRKPTLRLGASLGVTGTLTVQVQQTNEAVWYGAPTFTATEGTTSEWQSVPVSAAGTYITLGWHSSNAPSLRPAWVEFEHGVNPRLRILSTATDSNDVSPLILTATPTGGQTVLSPAGQGSITVNAVSSGTSSLSTTLTVYSQSAGPYPYLATLYPLEGEVNSGDVIVSDTDTNLRSSVLSTWPDGSAQVVVIAGEKALASGNNTIALRGGAPTGQPLTTERISQLVTSIAVDIPGVGSYNSALPAPLREWWKNERVICASYRLPIASGMSAIAYIQAFAIPSTRALVEVTVENGEVNATLSPPVAPPPRNYTGASVVVNGNITLASGVNSPTAGQVWDGRWAGTWGGGHEPGRGWYCKGWVGGDPQVEVTHDPAYVQQHPWYFKVLDTPTYSMQAKYGSDSYSPWSLGRLRFNNEPETGMNGGGDDEQIALFPDEQINYVATGDRYARRAVLATGLAFLSCAFHWRHNDGTVPQRSLHYLNKTYDGQYYHNWVSNTTFPRYGDGRGYCDGSHIPATTLTAFLCHPSPVFIEIAQKEGVWCHTQWGAVGDGAHYAEQTRSRAWRTRNMAIAAFLTPDADTVRKNDWQLAFAANTNKLVEFFAKPWNTLGILWAWDPSWISEYEIRPGNLYDMATFMQYHAIVSFNTVDRVKVIRGAAGDTFRNQVAKKLSEFPIRMVNEADNGTWRAQHIGIFVGQYVAGPPASIQHYADWKVVQDTMWTAMTTQPKAGGFVNPETGYSVNTVVSGAPPGSGYDAIFWSAFCSAVERGDVTGADQAWQFAYTDNGISGFQTWRGGFKDNTLRFARFPRNKVDTKVQPAATTLSNEAEFIAPGGWTSFTGSNINTVSNHPDSGESVHWFDDGRQNLGYQMFGYTGRGCYDADSRKVLWMGTGASSGGFQNDAANARRWNTRPIYSETTSGGRVANAWSADRAFVALGETPTATGAINHICDGNAIGNGKLYKYTYGNNVYVYDIANNLMEAPLPAVPNKPADHWWPALTFVPNRGSQGALWAFYRASDIVGFYVAEWLIGGSNWSIIKSMPTAVNEYEFIVMDYNPRAFGGDGGVMVSTSMGMYTLTTPNSGTPVLTQVNTSPGGVPTFGWYNSGFCRDPNGNGWIHVCNETLRVYQAAQSGGTYAWMDRGAIPSGLMSSTSNRYQFIVVPIDRNSFGMYGVVWVISYGVDGYGWSPSAYLYKPPQT